MLFNDHGPALNTSSQLDSEQITYNPFLATNFLHSDYDFRNDDMGESKQAVNLHKVSRMFVCKGKKVCNTIHWLNPQKD